MVLVLTRVVKSTGSMCPFYFYLFSLFLFLFSLFVF